eukprot:UN23387
MCSAIPATLVNGPTELIKCIAQCNQESKGYIREEWEICKNLVRQGGLWKRGLGRGFAMT